jgi:hypothetical protein
MRWVIAGLVGVLSAVGPAWQENALGQYIPIEGVGIVPQPPTISDSLTIFAYGEIGWLGIPVAFTHYSRSGTLQSLDIYFDFSGIHLPVVGSWGHSEPIGTLPTNTYNLTVRTYEFFGEPMLPVLADTHSIAYTVFPELGDANGDSKVDINDLNVVLANYDKSTGMNWATGDFKGDGIVDINDLNVLLSNYDQTSRASLAAVPEPASLLLLGISSIGLLSYGCRRRRA